MKVYLFSAFILMSCASSEAPMMKKMNGAVAAQKEAMGPHKETMKKAKEQCKADGKKFNGKALMKDLKKKSMEEIEKDLKKYCK